MSFKNFFLTRTIASIKEVMPPYVYSAIIKLLPVSFLLSIFEIVGLAIVVPVIQIMLKPQVIHSNPVLKKLYDLSQAPSEIIFVVYLFAFIFIVFLVKNLLTYWASSRQTTITYHLANQLTIDQFQNYLNQPYQKHVNDNTSLLLRRIIELPFNFISGIMLPVVILINELTVVALIILGILIYNPLLFFSVIFFILPFFALYGRYYKQKLKSMSEERDKGHSDMFRKGKQSIEGFREVLLFGKFDFFQPQFSNSVKKFSGAVGRLYHLNSFSPKIIETLAVFCVLGIFITGLIFNYDIGNLVAFLIAFAVSSYRLIPSVNKMLLSYNNIKSSEFVFKHYSEASRFETRNEKVMSEEITPLPFNEQFTLSHVSFSFSPDKLLLENINLTVRKGEIIGIVGKSGSGKSTLINLILGLYHPSSGSIVLDEVAITPENLRQWHKTISFVPQNPILIEGSIKENVAFGIHPDQMDINRMQSVIADSGLRDFVENLELGLDSHIGDKNLNISGGQKQRIAIARALYHNGRILIFDEATSSLDLETEKQLLDTFKSLAEKSYTLLIVAHRLETLKHCHRIHRLKDGRLSDFKLAEKAES